MLERGLSLEIAIVLFLVYVLSLVFSLKTHKDLFLGDEGEHQAHEEFKKGWSLRLSGHRAASGDRRRGNRERVSVSVLLRPRHACLGSD